MTTGNLKARLTSDHHGEPLASIDLLTPSLILSAEYARPAYLRTVAAALLKLADDADSRQTVHRGRRLPDVRKEYPLTAG